MRYRFVTPSKTLTMALETNRYTSWVTEHLVKEKRDIDAIAAHVTTPLCDAEAVNKEAEEYGERGLIRGHIPTFDVFGQPGCWQDACCLYGTEKMIMETFDDPAWVHEFLRTLQSRKLGDIASMKGARFDINELGGGRLLHCDLTVHFRGVRCALRFRAHQGGSRSGAAHRVPHLRRDDADPGKHRRTGPDAYWKLSALREWAGTRNLQRPSAASATRCA